MLMIYYCVENENIFNMFDLLNNLVAQKMDFFFVL